MVQEGRQAVFLIQRPTAHAGLGRLGPEFNSVEGNQADWKLAREVDARITVHVGVGTFGKHGKVAEVGKTGLYGPDTTYIHCTTLNDDEIQMIVDTGATVSLASPVEMMMGHGMVPTQKFSGSRPAPQPERRRRDQRAERHVHADALGDLPATRLAL